MLQTITTMYFRNVRLNETEHSRTLYTNANFLGRNRVNLPIGHLTPSTNWTDVNTALAHITERLEAVRPDGSDDFMISTGGDAIFDDLSVVLSFALNATFTPIREKADRLIGVPAGSHHSPAPADILPRTFSPQLMLTDHDLDDLSSFTTDLLALNRKVYERAMRAMRRIVTASERVAEDPTLSYTDYVAALESLSADFEASAPTWDRLDSRKRRILDQALGTLEAGDAERVRLGILESERAGIKNRFIEFVLSHVRPSFFREEAVGVIRPVRSTSLRRALGKAYDARSKNLHELRELSNGTWLLVGGAHTVRPANDSLMLTHEGLNNLARHVVRTYIQRGSTELDSSYKWRDHLPNIMRVQLASQFYLGHAEAWHPKVAETRAGEFLAHLIEAEAGRDKFKVDMRPALGRMEELLVTQRAPSVREPMLMVYLLWHRRMPPEVHQPHPEKTLAAAERELQQPSLYAYAAKTFLGIIPPWSVDELCELAEQRYEDMQKSRPVELPERLDSALWIHVAERLWADGAHDLACAAISRAVECSPGDEDLLALEQKVVAGHDIDFDVRTFLLGPTAANKN